jgi:hypothetical protein
VCSRMRVGITGSNPARNMYVVSVVCRQLEVSDPGLFFQRSPAECGMSECGVSECGVSECGVSECGVPECGMSECGMSECGVSECGVSECGLSECGVSECDSVASAVRNLRSTRDLLPYCGVLAFWIENQLPFISNPGCLIPLELRLRVSR